MAGNSKSPKVKNKPALKNLAKKTIRENRGKSMVIVLSIALTTFLFTALFTVSGSLMKKLQTETERQMGGSAMGAFKNLTEDEYAAVKDDRAIKEISRWIYVGEVRNPEMVKLRTEVHWTDDMSAEKGFCYPEEGRFPESADEIAASDLVLEALHITPEIGAKVPLTISIDTAIGESETLEREFTLVGIYAGDHVSMSQVVLVSKDFQETYAPTPAKSYYAAGSLQDVSDATGRLNADVDLYLPLAIEGQMQRIAARCGLPAGVDIGVSWALLSGSMDAETLALLIALLVTIFAAGYLIINNVYYINVYADIRSYGLLKTIGMSGRQLKKLVRYQAAYLSIPGILLGIVLGIGAGAYLLPVVMQNLAFNDTATTKVEWNLLIPLISALFSYITVLLSCRRPAKIAANVTPIEAVRYTEGVAATKKRRRARRNSLLSLAARNVFRDRRRAFSVVLSLTLSLVILNSVYGLISGFDENAFVAMFVANDFSVADATLDNPAIFAAKVTDGVTDEFLAALSEQDGVTDVGNIYLSEWVFQPLNDEDFGRFDERILQNEFVREYVTYPDGTNACDLAKDEHGVTAMVYGMDEFVAGGLPVLQGEFDAEKFESGDYIIVNAYGLGLPDNADPLPFFLPDEKITVANETGDTREYTVLAVIDLPYALRLQSYTNFDLCYILPTDEFSSFFGERQPMRTVFDTTDDAEENIEAWLSDYTENVEPQLAYSSRKVYRQEFQELNDMFQIVGGLVTAVLALIGLLNLVNLTVTSILSRRLELAMLEAVGMSKKTEMREMALEGLLYAALTAVVGALSCGLFSVALVRPFGAEMWYFTYHFSLVPLAVVLPFMAIVTALVPYIIFRTMMRMSVVERLRLAEG